MRVYEELRSSYQASPEAETPPGKDCRPSFKQMPRSAVFDFVRENDRNRGFIVDVDLGKKILVRAPRTSMEDS